MDKKSEFILRQKYQLYAESSDAETNNNTLRAPDKNAQRYQDLSLPAPRKINLPDSAKLHDLNVTKHRRTSSDTSKDKKAGAYVHVKGKRKAPAPPVKTTYPRTLSPKSSLGRKKRPAPQPPSLQKDIEASSTSLLEDKEIKAIIEGTSRKLSQNFSSSSVSSVGSEMERRTYVSPYLKIREDRKLTDEQKRILIEQVSKNTRKKESPRQSPHMAKRSTPDIFTIERGQLIYQGSESPKLPRKEEKPTAPVSPISPRPWFKRQSNSNLKEPTQKTLEKKRGRNDEKDLPELGYSRNSFFGSASRFNIFARITDDSKKKERDTEKRKSQIGMPNISELDREAAEIIQEMNQSQPKMNASEILMLRSQINNLKESADSDERPRSTKDLINKFEADSSQQNRITLNPAFLARKEFFGEKSSPELTKVAAADEVKVDEKPKSKLPQLIKETNGIRKQNDLMGLWTCPYCTLQNPNWKIICEACEKIKPYEKRFCVNGDLVRQKVESPKEPNDKENVWDKKTEAVLKYFNPPLATALSKSSSETAIVKSLKRKSPSPSRIAGSPQMNMRRNLLRTASEQETKIDVINEEETVEKNDMKVQKVEASAILQTTTMMYCAPVEVKLEPKTLTPDLNEIRSARIAKFNLMSNLKKIKSDDNSNAMNTNSKQSPEKKFADKLDFSDPAALEREKERLREKIRAMNAKALADKYPVLKRIPENEVNTPEPVADSSKLGAIRKVFKDRRESFDKDEKILNQENGKKAKVSNSVQTKTDAMKSARKSDEIDLVPTTVNEVAKPLPSEAELTTKEKTEVEEISDQLKSQDGIETFKATLRTKTINRTNTLAINKILRLLELAIAEGKYDEAAQLAMDLAKMKVSLSVTRQKERPKSDVETSTMDIRYGQHWH